MCCKVRDYALGSVLRTYLPDEQYQEDADLLTMLEAEDRNVIISMLRHRSEPNGPENGVILTDGGETVAFGVVVNGIYTGLNRGISLDLDEMIDYQPYKDAPVTVDTLYTTTIAGELAEGTLYHTPSNRLLGPDGSWDDDACPMIYTLNDLDSKATDAELLGAIDGYILGTVIPQLLRESSSAKISSLIKNYYANGIGNGNSFKSSSRKSLLRELVTDVRLTEESEKIASFYGTIRRGLNSGETYQEAIRKVMKMQENNWKSGVNIIETFLIGLLHRVSDEVDQADDLIIKANYIPETVDVFFTDYLTMDCSSFPATNTMSYFISLVKKLESQDNLKIQGMSESFLGLTDYFINIPQYEPLNIVKNSKRIRSYEWNIVAELMNPVFEEERELGVLKDNGVDSVSISHVLAGILGGLKRGMTAGYDSFYAATIAGGMLQLNKASVVAQIGSRGYFDDSCPKHFYPPSSIVPSHAHIMGSTDGFNIGYYIKTIKARDSSLKLSTVLEKYYSEDGLTGYTDIKASNRFTTVLSLLGQNLEARTK